LEVAAECPVEDAPPVEAIFPEEPVDEDPVDAE